MCWCVYLTVTQYHRLKYIIWWRFLIRHRPLPPPLPSLPSFQVVELGPCIIPDEPVGKKVVEQVVYIKDLDGYTFEVSEAAYRRDPVSKVSLLVLDMEKTINFYQDVSWAISGSISGSSREGRRRGGGAVRAVGLAHVGLVSLPV